MIEDIEERGWTGFRADDTGLLLLDYMIRGFFKEQADSLRESNALSARNAKDNDKAVGGIKGKIDRHLFAAPRRIYILDETTGKPISKPDGVVERPLRTMTMQGPRVTLVRSDMVKSGRILKFEIATTWPQLFSEDVIRQILERGAFVGLGQWRNASHGGPARAMRGCVRPGGVAFGFGVVSSCVALSCNGAVSIDRVERSGVRAKSR